MPTVQGAGSVNPTVAVGTDTTVATQVAAMIRTAAATTNFSGGGIAPAPGATPAALAVSRTGQVNVTASNYQYVVVGNEPNGDVSTLAIYGSGLSGQGVVIGTGSAAYYAGGGSGTVVGGDGGKTVDIGNGDGFAIYTGGGNDVISMANSRGSAVDSVDAGLGGNSIIGGAAPMLVRSSGADTINVASGAVTVEGVGFGQATVSGGSGNRTVVNASASTSVAGGSGSTTAIGGLGGGAYTGGSAGGNLLIGGAGSATLGGAGNADVLIATSTQTPQYLIAGAGNETLLGSLSNQNNVYAAGSGVDLILAGGGNDTIYGGAGIATVSGGGGANLYVFDPSRSAGGSVTVTDFAPGADHLRLQNYGGVNTAALAAGAQRVGSGERLTLPDGTTITLQNVGSVNTGFFG